MPNCPYCDGPLPGTEKLCRSCYETTYANVGAPKRSFLQQIQERISNPLRLRPGVGKLPLSIPGATAFFVFGLFTCWIGGLVRLYGDQSLFSEEVLRGAVATFFIAALISALLTRLKWIVYWRVLPETFAYVSFLIASFYFVHFYYDAENHSFTTRYLWRAGFTVIEVLILGTLLKRFGSRIFF